jgi:hypothetical protein
MEMVRNGAFQDAAFQDAALLWRVQAKKSTARISREKSRRQNPDMLPDMAAL